ncbi:hypothetical protein GCM10025774_25300 [Microbacterium kyungheense]
MAEGPEGPEDPAEGVDPVGVQPVAAVAEGTGAGDGSGTEEVGNAAVGGGEDWPRRGPGASSSPRVRSRIKASSRSGLAVRPIGGFTGRVVR